MIEWVPGNQEVRDSSRSGPSEGTVRTNSQSLGKGLGYKICIRILNLSLIINIPLEFL